MGAGGGWLRKTISHYEFDQTHYGYFHSAFDKSWVSCGHGDSTMGSQVTFSGRYRFNFFCNHIFKLYHLTNNHFVSMHRYLKILKYHTLYFVENH